MGRGDGMSGWWSIGAFVLGLMCRLTITKEPDTETYVRGFKDGLKEARREKT